MNKEAGQHATEAPTASLVSHNIICFLSAHLKWKMRYAKVSAAAFLQGETLDDNKVIYIKVPKGYPETMSEHLKQRLVAMIGGAVREDVVKLKKEASGWQNPCGVGISS